jgi:AcrR family transcriptional regulator
VTETAARAEPRRLPPGSHGIPAAIVARNQRERLIAAMAEACAERGFAETSVADVVKRAGVSTVTFYKQFGDKRDCILATHRQLLGRLLQAVDGARDDATGSGAKSRAVIHTVLAVFAADAPSARLLTVEILAAGPEGAKRHDTMVEAVADRLGVDWMRAAGIFSLVGKLVMAGEAARLPDLEAELVSALPRP